MIHEMLRRALSPHNTRHTIANAHLGELDLSAKRSKVAILGGMARACLWPRDNEDYEVWCCNAMWGLASDSQGRFRADRWFELHPWWTQSVSDMANLQACPVPVYMLDIHEQAHPNGTPFEVPNALNFPLDRLLALHAHDYFTCTFAYQIALAIALGFDEIMLVGLALIEAREALIERPCVEFWCGVAMAQKIKIVIPGIDGLGQVPLIWSPFRYGFEYGQEKEWVEKYCERAVKRIKPGWKSE